MVKRSPLLIAVCLLAIISMTLVNGPVNAGVPAQNKIEIKFWHAMGSDARLKAIKQIIDSFEAANPDIHVTAEFKGGYADLFNATLLVSRQKSAPNIVQPYEVGS